MDIYKTDFILVKEHNFSLSELDNLQHFERQIFVALVMDYNEKKKQKLKEMG